ncbi:hypothetical protein J4558_21980 [Leptolyngbya sp. 15MV]|nr:hypothetical protein J4558_21980 [Leptolyngbya sp. 15MV]
MWVEHTDYDLPGIGERIEIRRFYNSMIQSSGMFGFGWSTKYDESLWIYGDRLLRLNLPDARAVYFGRRLTTDPFESLTFDFQGQIVKEADGTFLLTFKDGRTHKFDQTGRLLWQRDRNQNQTTLAYDVNGRLATVTDAFGRTLTFTMSANGYVEEISDALGSVATYEYFPGTGRLKTVTFADASKYKFEYNTTAVYGKVFLATVKDALDNILETHLYDSSGRATTSELQGGVEKYEFDYTNLTGSNPYTAPSHRDRTRPDLIRRGRCHHRSIRRHPTNHPRTSRRPTNLRMNRPTTCRNFRRRTCPTMRPSSPPMTSRSTRPTNSRRQNCSCPSCSCRKSWYSKATANSSASVTSSSSSRSTTSGRCSRACALSRTCCS